MSIHQKMEIDITLLTRYLSGEATPEEAMAIDDWLTDSTHSQEFAQLRQTWQLLPGNKTWNAPSAAREWETLLTQLPKEPPAGSLRRLLIRYAVAAVMTGILFIAGLYGYYQLRGEKNIIWQPVPVQSTRYAIRKGVLPDGSAIVINRNSTLQYAADYNQQDRKLLLQGEGYFDVMTDGDRPFIVHTSDLKIQVLGTSFNVREDFAARVITVAVNSGKVKLYTTNKELIVPAGKTGVYAITTGALTLSDTTDINVFSYVTHDFSFDDMPLPAICHYLENTFNVQVILENEQLSQCRMSAHFKGRSVAYIMDMIAATLNIDYTIKDNTIYISGNGCN